MNKYDYRNIAILDEVMYENCVTNPQWIGSFFLRLKKTRNYEDFKKYAISTNITSTAINYILDDILKNAVINTSEELLLDEIGEHVLLETGRTWLKEVIINGCATIICYPFSEKQIYEIWNAQYLNFEGTEPIGVEYKKEKNCNLPILSEHVSQKEIEVINFLEKFRDIPFKPYTNLSNIDKYPNWLGKGYPERFRNTFGLLCEKLTEINLKSNLFSTLFVYKGTEVTNPADPTAAKTQIYLDPLSIVKIATDADFAQMDSKYDAVVEMKMIEGYKDEIVKAASIPQNYLFENNIGKVESGVALQLTFQPYLSLIARLRNEFVPKMEEFIAKSLQTQAYLNGSLIKEPEVNIILNDDIINETLTSAQTLDYILKLVPLGLIEKDRAKEIVEEII